MSSAVSSLSSTGLSFSKMDEKEKQQALEEEQSRLQALKVTDNFLSILLPNQAEFQKYYNATVAIGLLRGK